MEDRKNKKINILFVLPNFDTGGSEKLVVDLVAHLDKDRFNPVVCVFFSGMYESTHHNKIAQKEKIKVGSSSKSKPSDVIPLDEDDEF